MQCLLDQKVRTILYKTEIISKPWISILPTENHQMEHAHARTTRFSIFVSVRRDMVLPGEHWEWGRHIFLFSLAWQLQGSGAADQPGERLGGYNARGWDSM
jgi:hypothetical protein